MTQGEIVMAQEYLGIPFITSTSPKAYPTNNSEIGTKKLLDSVFSYVY